MAANEKYVLDLSGAAIKKLEKRDGVGIKHLILDNNELTKLENLECFPDVEKVSASGNTIVRMYGVSKCHHITHLNLPNNHIISIEGLKEMPNLTFLNLSVNNIKVIHNLQHSNNLVHLDLSRNNISAISDISNLTKLEVLHLNGNKISTLDHASKYFPSCICTLSLADNCLADLNEISHLVKLHCLEQLTILGNPCLSSERLSLPPFDYRPFVINWCLGLRLLDGGVATQKESLKAEWLYSQGKGRHFKPGEHVELIEYLCQVCPVVADQSTTEEEDEKLIRILHKQRQHKEQFLNEMSQVPQNEAFEPTRGQTSAMTQSYHFKTETSPMKGIETDMSASCIVPSKIMYESAPEVLFHPTSESAQSAPPSSFQSGKYPRSVSKSEILQQQQLGSVKSPIMIEQVEEANPKVDQSKSLYQNYEDRRVRPSSSSEVRPPHTPKGTLVRKVSKRATSPCTSSAPPSRSRLPHSTSKSRISPSRSSCILTAARLHAKNSSESDTSEEVAARTPQQRSFRSLSQSGHASPVASALSPTKRAFGMDSGIALSTNGSPKYTPKPKTLAEVYGKSEEDIEKAAVKIQSLWRGYYVRHHNQKVSKLLQEIRFRRLEDHIQHLHGHLCRLTDFVLRQQQDLQHERELRKMQAEDIRHLHEKAKDLQKNVSVALSKTKNNVFQNLSEVDSSSKDLLREGSKLEKQQSSDSLNLALRYSSQVYHENSSMYSPSSQTSSVASSVPDIPFSSRSKSRLQPSNSDVSDADSGLQSMVSPNVAASAEHLSMNGFGNDPGSFVGERRQPKDDNYEDASAQGKGIQQLKHLASLRHAMPPMATIPSSGEDLAYPSHPPRIKPVHFGKNSMLLNKTSYVEYPNSSVENSPCSANGEPFAFSRQPSYNTSCCAKDKVPPHRCAKARPSDDPRPLLPKRLNQLHHQVSSPLEDKDSPSSPCTVEMSGCISHSCSFQSDGYAAEELSATATLKLFSTRAVSVTCTNGAMSPQTPGPLTFGDASPQANLRSPLVLAASVWEKKVQDIESTFHQLQTQIRDLEGAFGQIGQFGQFFYPSILQDEAKESRPAIHCGEPAPGTLVLDMPKINFKRSDSGSERMFQTRFPAPYSVPQSQAGDCRVEEIEQEVQPMPEERGDVSNSNNETKS